MKTSQEIRQEFIDFFLRRNHVFIPSSSVVPHDDPTLLFTNAGMNQFKDIFLNTRQPEYPRAVNSQKCIRVSGKHNDLEEVGRDTYHHTFFEMLGNWSFGDYFKSEAIAWAWELFTEVWKLDKSRLWATVFGGDSIDNLPPDIEAEKLWCTVTDIPSERVLRFGRKDNFWEMGDVGPCGPCSEIHLDLGPEFCNKRGQAHHKCYVNGDCGRFIELWNLVFIQFNRDEKGKLDNLPARHVDTGAGLERIVAVLQHKTGNYETDLFLPIIRHLEEIAHVKYNGSIESQNDIAFRVVADHVRTLTFAITDGALPSNDGRGYVLRRILRRAARFGLVLDIHEPFIYRLVPTVVDIMGKAFTEITTRSEHAMNVIRAEEQSFGRTLERGMDIFEADIAELEKNHQRELSGEKAFRLYDTYGFPLDLTQLMAQERGLTIDVKGFNKLMQQQRARAREAQKNITYESDTLAQILPETNDAQKYYILEMTSRLMGYIDDEEYITKGIVPKGKNVGLILESTCAYAESGGQIGDKGYIKSPNGTFKFTDTRKVGAAVVHFGQIDKGGDINVGETVTVSIDLSRKDTQRNHTATHLLQWALQQVLGNHVQQEGSLVCPEYLRFDFTHHKALTKEQIAAVESLVREKIEGAFPALATVMPIDQARKLGAMALFSEKYGDTVRVLAIGADSPENISQAFSREFCGGTHVSNTADISVFKIIREESVATGVRRITAMTGEHLKQFLYENSEKIEMLCNRLKTNSESLIERVDKLLATNKQLQKQLAKGAGVDMKTAAQKLLDEALQIDSAKIIIGQIPPAPIEAIRSQIDWLRQKATSAAIVLGSSISDDKVLLIAAVTDDLISRGLKAGNIVKAIAPIVGGGGGGRPQMAQAGGKHPEKLPDALAKAREIIRQVIS